MNMFRAHSAYHQKVHDSNCTNEASGIVTVCRSLSCATAKEGQRHLQRVTIPEAEFVQFESWTFWRWAECARNIYGNLINVIWLMNKKFVYQVGNNKELYYDARPTKYHDLFVW